MTGFCTIKAGIDELFSERIRREEVRRKDVLISKISRIDGVDYVFKKVDTNDKRALDQKASKMLSRFLQDHPDNSVKLFVEQQVAKARNYQSYFSKHETDSIHKTYYHDLERWINLLESVIIHRIYFFAGGRQMKSYYDFFEETGLVDKLRKKGVEIIPTHNYKKLKKERDARFASDKIKFLEEQKINVIESGEFEIMGFRLAWLRHELELVGTWLKPPPSHDGKIHMPTTSTQLEILKYQHDVKSEITAIEKLFNEDPFDQIFEKAILYGAIEKPSTEGQKHAERALIQYTFNIWLQENKGWEYGNPVQYKKLVTKENFKEYLIYNDSKVLAGQDVFEKEKASWQIKGVQPVKRKVENFSLRQIAIAYFVLGISITKGNALEIIKKHSDFKSGARLLTKRISKTSALTELSGHKPTDGKKRRDLLAAKRLVSGIKNKNAIKSIDNIINAFENNYDNTY